MSGKFFVVLFFVLTITSQVWSAELYISFRGSDSNDGASPERPRKSLELPASFRAEAVSKILIEGPATYTGSLVLKDLKGEAGAPIKIESYGAGIATLLSLEGQDALTLKNSSYVEISNLILVSGGGVSNGLVLVGENNSFRSVSVHDLWISGFRASPLNLEGGRGLLIVGKGEGGYGKDLTVEDVSVYHNDYAGIQIYTKNTKRHQNIVLRRNKAYQNLGLAIALIHSGNGIVVSQSEDVLMEQNEAFDNGSKNVANGGPVGIWAWDAARVAIRKNLSYNNRTASQTDGGGFDFDGGVTDSYMEENVSYNNDGAGYLLCSYEGSADVSGIQIKNNISINDGRKNNYGALMVSGRIRDAQFLSNKIYFSGNRAEAVNTQSFEGSELSFKKNLIIAIEKLPLPSLDQLFNSTMALWTF